MAVGTTADYSVTRNDIIAAALRKCKAWPEDGNPPAHRIRDAIQTLNLFLREEDRKQTGLSKSLWALSSNYIELAVGRYIYGPDQDLASNIDDIVSVVYRDTSGGDGLVDWVRKEEYDALAEKDDTGEPQLVYLQKSRLLSDQKLFVWPVPATITTTSDTVVQSEKDYTCILKHTAGAENKPGSGSSWELYWRLDGDNTGTADTWVSGTEYDNGPLVIITYKRPLFDFDSQYDNPDFPLGWENYIIYNLAIRMAPEFDLGLEQRNDLRRELAEIKAAIFPSTVPNTNTAHNKATFF